MSVQPDEGRSRPRARNPRGEGERLRADLIAAVGRLLEEMPGEDDGPSLRAVARAAGITPQSVYLHFADKRELVGALFEERFTELAEELAAAARSAGDDPRARLRALCMAYCSFAVRSPGLYRVLFSNPTLPRQEPGKQRGMPALIVLDDAIRACTGEAPGQGPSSTTLCVWASMHGLVLLRRDRPNLSWPDLENLVDEVLSAHVG
ncbi:TetR/AcrR family transcriptional regulator [Nonomuraea jabiensis]|uniref:AcrR family transcriptional regulator n=1 Tax=Nonomuraea jabiensis TaxID=882448 RepID=A0A7W9GEB4_9ACTN|nr:TetR/AcrR family transcriptional regulator [Nonomuraea jabiensis]MBB5782244.1 AcrR family transcriptional regulator [Nonomuraea jabiensis]